MARANQTQNLQNGIQINLVLKEEDTTEDKDEDDQEQEQDKELELLQRRSQKLKEELSES